MPSLIDRYDELVGSALRPDAAQRRVVEHLETLRQRLTMQPGRLRRIIGPAGMPDGLYLWGDVGVGKSMLVDLLVAHADGISVKRWHFQAFMRALHRAVHAARARDVAEPLDTAVDDMIEGLALLALDEVEITDIVDAMIVGRVFERLRDRNVVVVATSNRAPERLYEQGPKREVFLPFVRFIASTMDVVELAAAQDYRRSSGRTRRDVYFIGRTDRIDRMWNTLGGPETSHPVLGERISIRRKGKVLRSEFDRLCRVAVGAGQYADLASFADTMFLENIPQMGLRDEDAARRFIMLIDAIYDRRKALVVSAEAEPDALYAGEEFRGAFRRTASRLYQMRADGWPGVDPS